MSASASREQRRQLARDNEKFPLILQDVPRTDWPNTPTSNPRLRVMRSRHFLVQEFEESDPAVLVRLSVNRTTIDPKGWADNIGWDDLQMVKNQCGYAALDAVEIYPPAHDVVNVANMRHLWVMREKLPFAWRKY